MRRWLTVGLILFLLGAGVVGSVFWLIATPEGARWLFKAASRWTGAQIRVEGLSGRIIDVLNLRNIEMRWPEGTIRIDQMVIHWRPLYLLMGRVEFDKVELGRVQVQDDRPESKEPPDLTWPKIDSLPARLGLEVKSFRTKRWAYHRLDRPPVTLEDISAHVTWGRGELGVSRLVFETERGRVEGRGEVSFLKPSLQLDFDISLKEAVIDLNRFSIHAELEHPGGSGQMAGSVVLSAGSPTSERLLLKTGVKLMSKSIRLQRMLLSQPGRKGSISGDGEIDLSAQEPRIKLELKLVELDLSKELVVTPNLSGELTVEGTPHRYQGRFRFGNAARAWRSAELSGEFQGNLNGIKGSILDGTVLTGRLEGTFEVLWSDGSSIKARLRGRDLDPGRITPEWYGKINLTLEGELRWAPSGSAEGTLRAHLLESHLRGRALTGDIVARVDHGDLGLTRAEFQGKGFDLSARGMLKEQLRFEARVTDLSGLVPGTRGSFSAKGWTRWKGGQWAGSMAGQGQDLLLNGLKAGNVNLAARLDEGEEGRIDLDVKIEKWIYGTIHADLASLKAEGTLRDHRIEFEIQWPEGDAKGRLAGAYVENAWEGTLIGLSGSYPRNRIWKMHFPTTLTVSRKKIGLGSMVMTSATGEKVQARAEFAPESMSGFIESEWEQFDLARVNPWLGRSQIQGRASGKLKAQWVGKDRISLAASADGEGTFRNGPTELNFSRGVVGLDWNERGLKAHWEVDLADGGMADGELVSSQSARFSFPEEVKFRTALRGFDLFLLRPYISKAVILEGRLSGNASGQWLKEQRFETAGALQISGGRAGWRSGGEAIHSNLRVAEIVWSWSEDGLRGNVSLALEEYGELKARFNLPLTPRFPVAVRNGGPLRVSLRGQFREKGLLASLFPHRIQESRGEVDLTLNADGTWENPQVESRVRVKNGAVRLLKESSPAREKDFTTATESIPVDISKALAEVNWDEKGFVCSLQLELPKGGRINGKFSSPYGGKFVLPERGNLSGAWEGVDMSLLRPWTPPALGLDGTLQGKFDGEWLTDKRFTLKGEVKVAQGTAAWKEKNGVINVKLSTADLHMSWRDEVLAGDLRLTLENFGRVAGTFRLPLPARMPVKIEEREPVQFSLQGQAQELGMLSVLFPGSVEESRGELEMDLKGDGTWEKPRFEGRLSLTKAGAYLPGSGIHLEDVLLEAHSTADELRITSFRVHSGPGYLEGSGTISIKEGKLLRYEGNLRGERFETIHLPELEALANPRLDLEGTLEGLTVRGEIVIPELSLLGEQKKGVIRPSPDVVIVDAREDPEVSPALRLNGQVRVVLGDKVQVKAEGIDAQLTGSVMLNFRGSKEMIAHGEIRVSKGSYNAYGQKLEITRGRLLFDGPPDQPTLDVLALRKIRRPSRWEEQMNEIEAGVMVTGTLQSPLIRLYSRPSMPETDILSYIVLGVPISQGGNQNQMGVLVGAAGALLSAGEAALLQNQLLGGSGLDSLDIQISQPTEAGESTRSSQSKTGEITRSLITVGKYLNPQLFVGVGASLYNNTYQLILRYSLSKKIEIESRTGNQSGVSLFYKLWFK